MSESQNNKGCFGCVGPAMVLALIIFIVLTGVAAVVKDVWIDLHDGNQEVQKDRNDNKISVWQTYSISEDWQKISTRVAQLRQPKTSTHSAISSRQRLSRYKLSTSNESDWSDNRVGSTCFLVGRKTSMEVRVNIIPVAVA